LTKGAYLWIQKLFFNKAKKILSVSDPIKEEYEARTNRKITTILPLIPYEVLTRSRTELRKELGVKEERRRILEIIDIMRKDLNNLDYSYSNEWIENFLEGLKAKIRGDER